MNNDDINNISEMDDCDELAELSKKAGYTDLEKRFSELQKRETKHSIIFGAFTLLLFVMVIVVLVLTIVRIQYTKEVKESFDKMNQQAEGDSENFNDVLTKLELLKHYISSNYLFDEDIKISGIGDELYHTMVDSLDDPYSKYYNAEEYKEFSNSSTATFCGIGAAVSKDAETDYMLISSVYEKSGAEEAGLLEGDLITAIEGESVKGQELTELVKKTRGEENTVVSITVYRPSTDETIDFTITRKKVDMITCSGAMLEDNIGVMIISQFGNDTPNQFRKVYNSLIDEGMQALIVDIRDNPGGQVPSVNAVLDFLLPEGIVVYTEDKNGKRVDYRSEPSCVNIPMAVLQNENSASSAEIFAGALHDYGWATLIGTKTFGKGIVQSIHNLGDGSAIKLTVARYFTPNGTCIHGLGIEPDIELEYEPDMEEDTWRMDNQVLKAFEVLKEKLNK